MAAVDFAEWYMLKQQWFVSLFLQVISCQYLGKRTPSDCYLETCTERFRTDSPDSVLVLMFHLSRDV